jgi:hypothetical protein
MLGNLLSIAPSRSPDLEVVHPILAATHASASVALHDPVATTQLPLSGGLRVYTVLWLHVLQKMLTFFRID